MSRYPQSANKMPQWEAQCTALRANRNGLCVTRPKLFCTYSCFFLSGDCAFGGGFDQLDVFCQDATGCIYGRAVAKCVRRPLDFASVQVHREWLSVGVDGDAVALARWRWDRPSEPLVPIWPDDHAVCHQRNAIGNQADSPHHT